MEMCSFWYLQRRVLLHKIIMIFVKGSIYADAFILIFWGEYCYIKRLWYLAKDQYMEMCSFWYLQSGVLLHKMIMIFGKGSIYGDVFILIFTEESIVYIKWLWYLSKDQYMADVVYFEIYRVLLHKMIMIFVKGSIFGDVFILIFTELSIVT